MDYLIIGAGPAGLQLGYFLAQARRDYMILEAGPTAGTFFHTFPRHRRLISINKPHTGWDDPELNLRTDWNSSATACAPCIACSNASTMAWPGRTLACRRIRRR